MLLVYILLMLLALSSATVGVIYNKVNAKKESNIQEYVKINLGVLGIKGNGTSLDNKDIYLVPYSKMGY